MTAKSWKKGEIYKRYIQEANALAISINPVRFYPAKNAIMGSVQSGECRRINCHQLAVIIVAKCLFETN